MKKNTCPFVDSCYAEKDSCYLHKLFGKKLPKGVRPKCFVSEEESLMIRARARRKGQEMKDNERWFRDRKSGSEPSLTKREKKRIEKLRKKNCLRKEG